MCIHCNRLRYMCVWVVGGGGGGGEGGDPAAMSM